MVLSKQGLPWDMGLRKVEGPGLGQDRQDSESGAGMAQSCKPARIQLGFGGEDPCWNPKKG